ncbi:MAG TPA: hypothetical protein PLR86_07845, partial [Planctomycetota bacterium]|nr:hypothetical protein [Planctomycetota bacterium]
MRIPSSTNGKFSSFQCFQIFKISLLEVAYSIVDLETIMQMVSTCLMHAKIPLSSSAVLGIMAMTIWHHGRD